MIFRTNYAFGNKEIYLTTLKKQSAKLSESLIFLIKELSKELNHNITDSSAWKFNKGQTSIAIYVKPEFIQYFRYVYNLFTKYPDTFNPYNFRNINNAEIDIDDEEQYIIKNTDLNLDTSYFRNTFILEFIAQYLKEKEVNEFLLEWDYYFIARGKNGWIIKFEETSTNLINSSAIGFNYEPSGFKSHKFGAIENDLSEGPCFATGDDLSRLKILVPQIKYVNTKTGMKNFSEENNIQIIFDKHRK